MKNILSIVVILTACLFLNTSCKKESTSTTDTNNNNNNNNPNAGLPIPSNLIKIGEAYVLGAKAKAVVYADQAFFVGYNKVYVAMYDSVDNSRLTDGHFELEPHMEMDSSVHNAPYELTEETTPSDQLWKGAIVFLMPSNPGIWELHLHFHNHKNNFEGEGSLPLNIIAPAKERLFSFNDSTRNNRVVYISMVNPVSPKIGINDFEVTAHQTLNTDTFALVDDYTMEINPIMVSMGHSSPNNVNPSYTTLGHYAGKVHFTMSGLWRINMTIKRNGIMVDNSHYFDVEF